MLTNDQQLIYEAYEHIARDSEEYSVFIEVELDSSKTESKVLNAFQQVFNRFNRSGAISLSPGSVITSKSGNKTIAQYDAYIKRGRRYIDPEEDNAGYIPSYIETASSEVYDTLDGYNSSDDVVLQGDDGEPPEHVSSFEIPGERVTIRYVLSF